jgi:purine-nucleoside/S-methyl-5'-thioadenosine phosphorylase / adenosine deaminase
MKTIKSTRLEGNSYFGNNLAYHVNDIKEDVDRNQHELALHLGYSFERLVHMNQVHGDKIISINNSIEAGAVPICDAVMTQEKNRPLMVMVADCIPVLIYDPVQEAIAAIHAGRAGIFTEIIPKSIKKMQKEYGSKTKDLLIVLGPSIHQCCYEVGSEIKDTSATSGYGYAIRSEKDRYYLDLICIANKQLESCGVEKKNIEVSNHCTACDTDTFYSYRAEKNNCGRFAGVIMLK